MKDAHPTTSGKTSSNVLRGNPVDPLEKITAEWEFVTIVYLALFHGWDSRMCVMVTTRVGQQICPNPKRICYDCIQCC